MAINTPLLQPNIAINPAGETASEREMRLILSGLSQGGDLAKQAIDNKSALAKLLMGSKLDEQAKSADLARASEALSNGSIPEGASLASGSAHIGQSPEAKNAEKEKSEESKLRAKIIQSYGKDSEKVGSHLEAAKGMLNALNSNSPTSPAELIANFYALHGIKRFSPSESQRIAPVGAEEFIGQKLQGLGIDPSKLLSGEYQNKGFNDLQKASFAKLANDHLSQVEDSIKSANEKAVNDYSAGAYQSPAGLAAIQARIGQNHALGDIGSTRSGLSALINPKPAGGPGAAMPAPSAPKILSREEWEALKRGQ